MASGADTQTQTHAYICTEVILRNETGFKKDLLVNLCDILWDNMRLYAFTRNTQKDMYTRTCKHTRGTRNTRLTCSWFVSYVTELVI